MLTILNRRHYCVEQSLAFWGAYIVCSLIHLCCDCALYQQLRASTAACRQQLASSWILHAVLDLIDSIAASADCAYTPLIFHLITFNLIRKWFIYCITYMYRFGIDVYLLRLCCFREGSCGHVNQTVIIYNCKHVCRCVEYHIDHSLKQQLSVD